MRPIEGIKGYIGQIKKEFSVEHANKWAFEIEIYCDKESIWLGPLGAFDNEDQAQKAMKEAVEKITRAYKENVNADAVFLDMFKLNETNQELH